MLTRRHGNLRLRKEPAPPASEHLEREGYALIQGVLTPDEVAELGAEIAAIFDASGTDRERDARNEFRYGMLNRSALAQKAIAARGILDAIEPLLGEDCHVIANTAWRNAPGHQGGMWHCDAGPHIPRPENVPWPDAIPYPVFAIGVHIFLWDCPMEAGPTAVLPGSHRSGRLPPKERLADLDLSFETRRRFTCRPRRAMRSCSYRTLASRHARAAGTGALFPAMSLRPPRPGAAHKHNSRGQSPVARRHRACANRSREDADRSAPTVLLRRLTFHFQM